MRRLTTVGIVAAALLAGPLAAQPEGAHCRMAGADAVAQGSEPLSEAALEAVGLALQDEYRAEGLYQQVLERHGDVRPFAHIVYAEQRHSAALERVYSRRGLVAPDNHWPDLGQELPGETLQQVCQAAVEAERDNVSLYDELLGRDLPADVFMVFEHLRQASLERHLPAFERCASGSPAAGPSEKVAGQCCHQCRRSQETEAGR